MDEQLSPSPGLSQPASPCSTISPTLGIPQQASYLSSFWPVSLGAILLSTCGVKDGPALSLPADPWDFQLLTPKKEELAMTWHAPLQDARPSPL